MSQHTWKRLTHSQTAWCFRLLLLLTFCTPHTWAAESSIPEKPRCISQVVTEIILNPGMSEVLQVPWAAKRVAVSSPEVADVQIIEPDQILIVGKGTGLTDFILWNEEGKIWRSSIRVELSLEQLNDELKLMFSQEPINVSRSGDMYVLKGSLSSAEYIEVLHDFMETRKLKYIDMTRLEGVQQVKIKVRVAEINRTAIRNMTVNALQVNDSWFGASTVGTSSGGAFNHVNIGVPKGAPAVQDLPFGFLGDTQVNLMTTLLAGFPHSDLEFFIEALQENQYLQILAEPTMVALSGEEASFLAGGEFPIPVAQGQGSSGTSISLEYKEFGVRLRFLPLVLGDGTIRLQVAPEVSELSEIGAVELQGFRVPSILTRRSETTIEMKSGQTFAMAGLLNQTTTARRSSIPLLGGIPVLGPLFRSVSYQKGESELLVLVTAELAAPMNHGQKDVLPGELHVEPNDWELFVKGHIEGKMKRISYYDGVKINIEDLKELIGPGAWASYHP